jgi:hypothetical protein
MKPFFLYNKTILVLLESCLQTCMTYSIVECAVNKLLMMGRGTARNMKISCRSKFGKLVHLIVFIIKKFVTMQHGHMNVKNKQTETRVKQLPSYRTRSATLPRSEPLPTTTTGHYTICCKQKSQFCAPEDGQNLPETCWADLGDQ